MEHGLKVVFAGTPEFALAALQRVHAADFEVPLVLTQPDRPAGRGMKLTASPVKRFAAAHRIAAAQPRSLRLDGRYPQDAEAALAALTAAAPDVMVVAAYGLILPGWALALPRLGCLNIHASLLPRWRGAAPIHRAIEAGDACTGITIMQMDAGLDTGDMLMVQRLAIAGDDTTATLQARLASLGGELIVQALRTLQVSGTGALVRQAQPADGVTYAHKIDKAEATIDWAEPAVAIERRTRAFDPFPGASTTLDGEVLKCWRAIVCEGVAQNPGALRAAPGTVLDAGDGGLVVACGEGALCLTALQRAGGKRLAVAPFLQGQPVAPGTVLGSSSG